MKQTITINIDVRDGYELKFNPETRTVEDVKKEPIRSKSWEEFCKNHNEEKGYYITASSDIDPFDVTSIACKGSRNILATKEDTEGILALIQLTRLHDEWVEDCKLNWEDGKDYKFGIYAYNNTIDIFTLTMSHRLLAFPSFSMAKEFLECFRDLIEKAKKFI